MNRLSIIVGAITLLFLSCSTDDGTECNINPTTAGVDQTQLALDLAIIDGYLMEEGITAIEHESGLRYVVTEAGEGGSPDLCTQVFVAYEGTLLDEDNIFDSSEGVAFNLSSLIIGWQIGFTELKKGESATLYIPSGLAYGNREVGDDIPANANLVFDVKLITF
jgi:FKBP-type peptidyl-prolyl cis-trans isomerase FkpA